MRSTARAGPLVLCLAMAWPGLSTGGSARAQEDAPAGEPGRSIYLRAGICSTCHGVDGRGIPGTYPPLAGSPWVEGDPTRLIKIVLCGLTGLLELEGEVFNTPMAPLGAVLDDLEIAAVLTYVRTSWGNRGSKVSPAIVTRVREQYGRRRMWGVGEILADHPLSAAGAIASAERSGNELRSNAFRVVGGVVVVFGILLALVIWAFTRGDPAGRVGMPVPGERKPTEE